jgi:hypothetical protein
MLWKPWLTASFDSVRCTSIAVLAEGKEGFEMTEVTEMPRSTILLSITPGERVESKKLLSKVPGVCLEINDE